MAARARVEDPEAAMTAWIVETLERFESEPDFHVDSATMDFTLGEKRKKRGCWSLEFAARAFDASLRAVPLIPQSIGLMFGLTLSQSPELDTYVPTWTEIGSQLTEPSPPNIYLFRRFLKIPPSSESYVHPFVQSRFTPPTGYVRAHYKCHRTAEAVAFAEPYDRSVVFEHVRELTPYFDWDTEWLERVPDSHC